jgi:phage terminase large subunit-like protein
MRRNAGSDRAVAIINRLTHTKGPTAGQPFRLRPWQETAIVRPLFATYRRGRRRYRTCLLMLPRKNGKTELAAAFAIHGLLFDGEMGGEIYSAAADKDQATLVFNVAAQMIRNDPELLADVEIIDSQKRIVHRASGSVYRAISAEAYSKHGFNASRVIYDELHAAPTRDLWDVLSTSMGARDQPLLIAISTAGYDRNSILYELYAHACRVQERPSIDPTFLPILYGAPADADWQDERVWAACNPALGDFRSLDEMRIAARRAREVPAQENTFRRLYLNQWTEAAARWIPLTAWDRCQTVDPVAVFRARLAGRRCYIGMDLSSTTDLTAIVAVFPRDDGGCDVLAHYFVPADTIPLRTTRDRVGYDEWVRRGYVTATPGNVVDYEAVRALLRAWAAVYDVREIAFDPWNATDLTTRLHDQDGFTCIPMRQGFSALAAPTQALEKAILGGTLHHDGDPVLRWNVGNAAAEQDAAGNIRVSKRRSTERIDGVSALVMAIDRLHRASAAPPPAYQMVVLT